MPFQVSLLQLLLTVTVATPFPGKLLRVPKVYNALITSKEKILPSEAYPASTGPIFQPIGLTGDALIIDPEITVGGNINDDVKLSPGATVVAKDTKSREPYLFLPRYSLYYSHQPYLTLQHPYYSFAAFGVPYRGGQLNLQQEALEREEEKDASMREVKTKPQTSSSRSQVFEEYVTNNRPADRNIPEIIPPPPSRRY